MSGVLHVEENDKKGDRQYVKKDENNGNCVYFDDAWLLIQQKA